MSLFPHVEFLVSAAQPAQFPDDRGAEVAFAGRSNVGKSSAINTIVQRHGLARVSKTPGRTRLLNFFAIGADSRIVDLPGYGYAAAPAAERRTWAPLIGALRERSSLRGLVLIVDSRRGVTPDDENLIAWAREGGDAREARMGIHVLLSKSDKLKRSESTQVLRESKARLEGTATVQLFSVLDKTGVAEAQRVLQDWTR
ncbi:MAG TPA: ribosome biogenesis GTP-binding protein YihA/YsxC [Steroidobacteraceae bacterium]|nr:ribosome biogenesis GTP-binding protein YihA/YsxC [Steroidobacteraceae bacterium]